MQQSLDMAAIIKSHLNVTLFIDLLTNRPGPIMLRLKYIRLISPHVRLDRTGHILSTWGETIFAVL